MCDIHSHVGNIELLTAHKVAFLCSRKIPASIVLRCYDWAIEQREKGICVISGFHSQIEKDVLHYLLKGTQPIIVALARGLKERIEPEFKEPLEKGRMLILTPFDKDIKRVTEKTAYARNRLMIELADEIALGFLSKNSTLSEILERSEKKIEEV